MPVSSFAAEGDPIKVKDWETGDYLKATFKAHGEDQTSDVQFDHEDGAEPNPVVNVANHRIMTVA